VPLWVAAINIAGNKYNHAVNLLLSMALQLSNFKYLDIILFIIENNRSINE
jgi:hypothetical protein